MPKAEFQTNGVNGEKYSKNGRKSYYKDGFEAWYTREKEE
jgi:hypothetical protein